jgi:hypothetical protein
MTIPGLGKLTPAQMFMLSLAGIKLALRGPPFVDPTRPGSKAIPDRDHIEIMNGGRAQLVALTGQDFGFDLKAWRAYLVDHQDSGYTHPYGIAVTRKLVAAAIADPERRRLVALLEADPSTTPPSKPPRRALERRAKAHRESAARLEGELKGRTAGRAAGERKGRIDTLLEQLGERFWPVPAATKTRIWAAETDVLARWLIRVLTAPSIEAVLDGRRKLSGPPAPKRGATPEPKRRRASPRT